VSRCRRDIELALFVRDVDVEVTQHVHAEQHEARRLRLGVWYERDVRLADGDAFERQRFEGIAIFLQRRVAIDLLKQRIVILEIEQGLRFFEAECRAMAPVSTVALTCLPSRSRNVVI
jgi:hypothetical protein